MCVWTYGSICCYTTLATIYIRRKNINDDSYWSLFSKQACLNVKGPLWNKCSVCVCVCVCVHMHTHVYVCVSISSMKSLGCPQTPSNMWTLPGSRVMCLISHPPSIGAVQNESCSLNLLEVQLRILIVLERLFPESRFSALSKSSDKHFIQ